jgi:hypothetical protein
MLLENTWLAAAFERAAPLSVAVVFPGRFWLHTAQQGTINASKVVDATSKTQRFVMAVLDSLYDVNRQNGSLITGNPHLTRRWPFGGVTEGLPTIHPQPGNEPVAERIAPDLAS